MGTYQHPFVHTYSLALWFHRTESLGLWVWSAEPGILAIRTFQKKAAAQGRAELLTASAVATHHGIQNHTLRYAQLPCCLHAFFQRLYLSSCILV